MVVVNKVAQLTVVLSVLVVGVLTFRLTLAQESTCNMDDASAGETVLSTESDQTVTDARRSTLMCIADALSAGDNDFVNQWVAEDYVLHSPLGEMNRAGLNGFISALRSSLTGFQFMRDEVIVEGGIAATRTRITGTFEGELALPTGVVPPNGQPVDLQVINFFRFNEAGQIVEEWAQFDNLGFLTQIGALPSPASTAQTSPREIPTTIRYVSHGAGSGTHFVLTKE
jgi:predicted ester cyclase